MTAAAIERDFNTKAVGSIVALTGILTFLCGSVSAHLRGSLYATVATQDHVALTPIVGGVALVIGLVLFLVPRRQQD